VLKRKGFSETILEARMKKRNKHRVFYFGADMPWKDLVDHGFRRRNTCLLQALVNDKNIDQVFVMKLLSRKEALKNIFQKQAKFDKVKDIFIAFLLPEKKYIPFAKSINYVFTQLLLLLQTGKMNHRNDIIWIYWIEAFLFAKKTKIKGRYFFDVDHNIIEDENLPDHKRHIIKETLLDIAKRSEKILSSSRSMNAWFKQHGFSNLVYLRNGIDSSRFSKPLYEPEDIKHLSSPRVLYVGTLSKWIDTDLFLELIEQHKTWNFIVIGENYKTEISKKLMQYPNVSLLGFKDAEEIPHYMANVNIGLGIYKNLHWLDVDSMKFYEYIAAGVPVISTNYHTNIEADFGHLIKTTMDIDEMGEAMNHFLFQKKQEKEIWRQKCDTFVNDHSWAKRVEQVVNIF